jgi:hypothetical protein
MDGTSTPAHPSPPPACRIRPLSIRLDVATRSQWRSPPIPDPFTDAAAPALARLLLRATAWWRRLRGSFLPTSCLFVAAAAAPVPTRLRWCRAGPGCGRPSLCYLSQRIKKSIWMVNVRKTANRAPNVPNLYA